MASWLAGPYSAMASVSAMEQAQDGDNTDSNFSISLWNEQYGALLNTSSSFLRRPHHNTTPGAESTILNDTLASQTSVSGLALTHIPAFPKESLLSPRYLTNNTVVKEVHTKQSSAHNVKTSVFSPPAAGLSSVRILRPHQPEVTNPARHPTELPNSAHKNVVICCCRKRTHTKWPRLLYVKEIRKLRRCLGRLAARFTTKKPIRLPSSTARLLENINKLLGIDLNSANQPYPSPSPSPSLSSVPTSVPRVYESSPSRSLNSNITSHPQIESEVQQASSSADQMLQHEPITPVDKTVSTVVEEEEDEYLSLLKSRMNESLGDLTSSIDNIVKSKGVTIAPFSRLSLFNDLSSSSVQQHPSSFSFTSHINNHDPSKATLFDDELHQLLRRVSMSSLSPAPSSIHVQHQSPPPKSPLNRSDLSLSPNETVISWLSSPEMLSPSPSLSRTNITTSMSRPSVPVFASTDMRHTSPSRKGPVTFSPPNHEPSDIRASKSALHVLSDKVRRTEGFFKRALDAIDPSIWPSTSPTT
eukprot:GILK01013029.1.p1 GENE.GILK01013029.1~~GILK01013029.1.p1  ORF type:complete len:541 (-),score=23.95 GILK01013029.1:81-1667(-)